MSARLAAGDELAAREAAGDGVVRLAKLSGAVRLGEAALARIGDVEAGTPAWADALNAATDALRPAVDGIRQREMAAESTTDTLAELDRQNIRGRLWLEAARGETEQPLLCLLPTAG